MNEIKENSQKETKRGFRAIHKTKLVQLNKTNITRVLPKSKEELLNDHQHLNFVPLNYLNVCFAVCVTVSQH